MKHNQLIGIVRLWITDPGVQIGTFEIKLRMLSIFRFLGIKGFLSFFSLFWFVKGNTNILEYQFFFAERGGIEPHTI